MNQAEIETKFKEIHPDYDIIHVKPLWDDKWRVNVYKKLPGYFGARHISDSYFCSSEGNELTCTPKIGD